MTRPREKAPAYQFYPRDYESDEAVKLMTYEEEGIYRRLLDHQAINGSLPHDPSQIARLVPKIAPARFLKLWPAMREKFAAREDGRLVNGKLERVKTATAAYVATKTDNGAEGGKATQEKRRTGSTAGSNSGSERAASGAANGKPASATASASPETHVRAHAWAPDAFMDAFREGWKSLYGHACSLIVKPVQFSQLQQQIAAIPEAQLRAALAAFFATEEAYIRTHKHPLGVFLNDPLRYLAAPLAQKPKRALPDASAFQWVCPHAPTCGNRAACAIVAARTPAATA